MLRGRRGKVTQVPETKRNGVGWAAKEIVDRARSIAKLEIELALIEVKRKVVRIAVGAGLGAGAAVVALFAIGFLTAGAAAALALAVPVWAALLIVGGALLGTTGLLAVLALRSLRAGTPPVPKEAIEEARLTTEVLKHDGR
ncbi:MAG TPA: phage holin family protein [Mycobacteriales bacterium]|nr:phage holin family protein [Mycobacteriales bacterium]